MSYGWLCSCVYIGFLRILNTLTTRGVGSTQIQSQDTHQHLTRSRVQKIWLALRRKNADEVESDLRIGGHHMPPTTARHLGSRPAQVWRPIWDDDFRITRSPSEEAIVVRASGKKVCAQCVRMRAMRSPIGKLGSAALCAQHEIAPLGGRALGGLSEMRRVSVLVVILADHA